MAKIAALNDLIELNNDRVAGFEKAMQDIADENADLKELFQRYSGQSRRFSAELNTLVAAVGGDIETGNTVTGTLHRVWIDVKTLFGANDRLSILREAARGEDAIADAYNSVLSDGALGGEALALVKEQAVAINNAHDEIKRLRDEADRNQNA